MNNFYPITIEEHQEGGFHAKCPLIQGAWADGDTIKEAVNNLKSIMADILEYKRLKSQEPLKFVEQQSWQGLALAV
ncbi:MAG: type II toxin-antitoxin system HicB family antitoxin [Patescibacteria group bacterium]|mgnify:CR=1 FL=1